DQVATQAAIKSVACQLDLVTERYRHRGGDRQRFARFDLLGIDDDDIGGSRAGTAARQLGEVDVGRGQDQLAADEDALAAALDGQVRADHDTRGGDVGGEESL